MCRYRHTGNGAAARTLPGWVHRPRLTHRLSVEWALLGAHGAPHSAQEWGTKASCVRSLRAPPRKDKEGGLPRGAPLLDSIQPGVHDNLEPLSLEGSLWQGGVGGTER